MKKYTAVFLVVLISFNCVAQKVNTSLQYLVSTPVKKSPKTPVLIMLHGYGSNEADLFDLSPGLDGRFLIFSLRAPNVVSAEGFAWYKMDFLADQKFRYNYNDVKDSRQKILSFISNACRAYGADSTQVYLLGFSQGAIMSYDLAFSAPSKISGIIALSGRMLEETKSVKADSKKLAGVKCFIAHGNLDNVIKINDAESANTFLKSKNVKDVTFNKYVMAHAITGTELDDIKRWLSSAADQKVQTTTQK